MNDRLDIIRKYMAEDEGIIEQCLRNVSDENHVTNDEESKWKQLILDLKNVPSPNPKEQLFPLGKVLWFVPKEVVTASDEQRRLH